MAEQVVFRRGEKEENNEIWDDTSLVVAYDKAIKACKEQMKSESHMEASGEQSDDKKASKKKKKNRRKQQAKGGGSDSQQKLDGKSPPYEWSVGESCRAMYTEDGLVYDAVIRSINPVTKTCVVRYRGYGNEEEQYLNDLIFPRLTDSLYERSIHSEEWMSEHDNSSMDYQPPMFSPGGRSGGGRSGGGRSGGGRSGSRGIDRRPGQPQSMQQHVYHDDFPGNTHSGARPFRYTDMPPPPIPPISGVGEGKDGDNEELYSMLMAWYMSGFHTGFYQGKKAGQQESRQKAAPQHPTCGMPGYGQ